MLNLKKKSDVFTLLLFGLGLAFLLQACKEEKVVMKPLEVKVTKVAVQDVPITREWIGQTIGAVDIEIRARVNGWLEGMFFKEGSEVSKGSLLYTIDPTELKEAVAEAEAKVASAKTLLMQAEEDVKRYTPLSKAGAVSKRDLEIAISKYDSRKSEVDAAQASLNIAMVNLGYANIVAPITGLIGISAARVGDFVGRPPNPVILNTISRIDSVHVRFSISEQEYLYLVKKLAEKDKAEPVKKREFEMILADGSLYNQKGYVIFAQRQIDPTTGTLQLEASFPNREKMLRPGQFAKVRTVVEERKGALVIPTRAIIELQGQFTVFVVDENNKVKHRIINTASTFGQYTVVESGLKAGDKVIVEGMLKVKPDMVVNPVEMSLSNEMQGNQGVKK